MEVVGGIATVLALVQLLAKLSWTLYEKWDDAPQELKVLTKDIQMLALALRKMQQISESRSTRQDQTFVDTLDDLLVQVKTSLSELETISLRLQRYGAHRLRLEWTMKHQRAVERISTRLRTVQQTILSWFIIICTLSNESTRSDLGEVMRMQKTTQDLLNVSRQPTGTCQGRGTNVIARSGTSERRTLSSLPWSTERAWDYFGIQGSLIPAKGAGFVDYDLAIQFRLPLAFVFGSYALALSISARTYPACPLRITTRHPSSLAITRFVDGDGPFMTACARGDLLAVRDMLKTGKGRATDLTETRWSPMTYAILNGNTDVVTELLNNGADVNGTFGYMQTTPLQWAIWQKQLDIVRLLLRRGASQDFINTLGWDTVFFCWPKLKTRQGCMLDYLGILADHSLLNLDTVDTTGWTALHRVAAYGTAEEVRRLLALGASMEQVALPLRWNALHHAVFYCNEDTYSLIMTLYPDDATKLVDERGWTLLHIAASAGHRAITENLLALGADPHARSKPFVSHMPESLFRRACTAQEVAAAQSPEREAQYLQALRDYGISDASTTCVGEEEKADDFWDAVEEL